MLTFDEALRAVLRQARRQPVGQVSLGESVGCVLAKEIKADRNLPPFHRSTMDGYTVRAIDLQQSRATLMVQGTIRPGEALRARPANRRPEPASTRFRSTPHSGSGRPGRTHREGRRAAPFRGIAWSQPLT